MTDDGTSPRVDRTELPEEIRADLPVPVPVHPLAPMVTYNGITMDNVNRAKTPSGLVPGAGEKGDDTEWDASSLDSAIDWLEAHASFLHNQSYEMVEIQDKMGGVAAGGVGGPGGGSSNPLGAFDRAGDLARKHSGLFTTSQQKVRALSESLYQAANALKEVKENYETAEKANEMSAAEMTRAFTQAPTGPTG
ncbi:hypothetical protein OG777_08795 [Micromonospora peucetia]|uniref:Uncharacterized protein n=1 Tax=Micromonospora peucetia TaxID=47871 RepID=A0A1C6UM38_9ACTN|nr:hypothetical protein [Micromonospora peucetia]MCX4387025.1 hypothetical protein [Micromonospora peucetia]WSA34392.1 hypothetical protein OIE14_10280 [Micromonospora peucetia]SCL55105.1 hypothetical protein GA0070608_1439 [Micromonospora peucetia]